MSASPSTNLTALGRRSGLHHSSRHRPGVALRHGGQRNGARENTALERRICVVGRYLLAAKWQHALFDVAGEHANRLRWNRHSVRRLLPRALSSPRTSLLGWHGRLWSRRRSTTVTTRLSGDGARRRHRVHRHQPHHRLAVHGHQLPRLLLRRRRVKQCLKKSAAAATSGEMEVVDSAITGAAKGDDRKRKANSAWRKFIRNKSAVIGLIIVIVMLAISIFAPFIAVRFERRINRRDLSRARRTAISSAPTIWYATCSAASFTVRA